MTTKNDGGPAFPMPAVTSEYGRIHDQEYGMTLRDYFAAKALPLAFLAMGKGYFESDNESMSSDVATCAYQMADAMLAAREKL